MRASINAKETILLYLAYQAQKTLAPLAKRLNLQRCNRELEDLAFKFLQPAIYRKIARLLDERRVDRERYILATTQQLEMCLKLNGVDCNVFGRAKHIYSIWSKMQRKMLSYNDIHDIHAFRIIVPSILDCYAALRIIHAGWQNIPEGFHDYISNPKRNGYKSLHTKIINVDGRILEVQIRTQQIHREADSGVFAHWRYKEQSAVHFR